MNIIPKPASVILKEGIFVFSASTSIEGASELINGELNFIDYKEGTRNRILFRIGDTGYDHEIEIADDITVTAKDEGGLFRAAMTLKQLFFEYYDSEKEISAVPQCAIYDKPRFAYRAYMIDVCRHWFGVDTVKRIADMLALVKINVLHLHLSDDQGFRIQCDTFPKLNSIGSKRKGTRGDGVPVEGYFTKEDIREIVAYCAERYIDVMPEIDLPGHTLAMLASYPELGCADEQYEVWDNFGITPKVLCAGSENTYAFIEKLLDEIVPLFPYGRFHIGGDEVPKKRWKECPKCARRMKEQGFDNYEQLQGYFTNRVINILKERGKVAVVWNEALNSGMLDESAAVQYWLGAQHKKHVAEAERRGRRFVVSKVFKYYLDYTYGMTSLKQTYMFEPTEEIRCEAQIDGVEAPLWAEWIETEQQVFEKTFPRLFAMAETAWSACGDKDYEDFKRRLDNVLGIMLAYEYPFTTADDAEPSLIKGWKQNLEFYGNIVKNLLYDAKRNKKQKAK